MDHSWIGIDYGSKLAGTTAICYLEKGTLTILQSQKKKDADQFIIDFCIGHKTDNIFIDAPLSLPKAYFGEGDDYFYRAADRELKAMSPMFLGGLTARAMKLKHRLGNGYTFHEVYPGALVRNHPVLKTHYNKKKAPSTDLIASLKELIPYSFELTNLHQFDAVLAWYIGHKYFSTNASVAGSESEGYIHY